MKKSIKANGFSTVVFCKGDGQLVRWADHMAKWRGIAPEKRRLAHPVSWYFDVDGRSRRPLFGLPSLAIFTERLLWEALGEFDHNGREVASSRRAFLLVRKKMTQMRYRKNKQGRVTRIGDKQYLRSCVAVCIAAAKKAYDQIEASRHRRKELQEELKYV